MYQEETVHGRLEITWPVRYPEQHPAESPDRG